MSLNYELGAIENWETVCKIDGKDDNGKSIRKMNPVTNGLIWATMGIGIGKITAENWQEFYARIRILDRLMLSTSLQERNEKTGEFEPRPFTAEEVKAHIGLTTNVFPKESLAKWSSRIVKDRLREITRAIA